MHLSWQWMALVLTCSQVLGLKFTTQQKNLEVREGGTARLECKVDSFKAGTFITWTKIAPGNKLLSFGSQKTDITNVRLDVDVDDATSTTSVNITIKNITTADAGTYSCQVTGTKLGQHTILEVLAQSQAKIEPDKKNLTLNIGETLNITCVTNGYPKPRVEWKHNGKAFGLSSSATENLLVQKVGRKDGGTYMCVADNDVGDPASDSIDVTVLFPPLVTLKNNKVVAGRGRQLIITCKFSASPIPSTSWTHNGIPLTKNGGDTGPTLYDRQTPSGGVESSLVIQSVTEGDLGMYSCFGKNSLGNDSAEILVTALPQDLTITSKPEGQYSDQYELVWTVKTVESPVEYRLMYRLDEPVPEKPAETQPPPAVATVAANLSMVVIDVPISNKTCTNCSYLAPAGNQGNGSLGEEKGGGEEMNVPFWQEEVIPAKGNMLRAGVYSQSYTIKDLKQNSTYIVKLKAKNDFGESGWTEEFKFQTSREKNPAPTRVSQTNSQDRIGVVNPTVPIVDDNGNGSGHPVICAATFIIFLLNMLQRNL